MAERLQKVLAQLGLGSRRQIEGWIREGRVTVNGSPAPLGTTLTGTEKVQVDGTTIHLRNTEQRRRVLAYYKPVGQITTRNDPEGRPTVFDQLPVLRAGRWISVGRLDISTQGLLLLTNDGGLANQLMHPSSGVVREYAVRVLGTVTPDILQQLQAGVQLDDGMARFDTLREVGGEGINRWYHVTLHEGRYRAVRRLWESQGLTVSRLTRVRYGTVTLRRGLRPGHWDELDDAAIAALVPAKVPAKVPAQKPSPARPKPQPQAQSTVRGKHRV